MAGTWALVASLYAALPPALQTVVVLTAVASTLIAMKLAGLYRSEVYSLMSRLTTRVVTSAVIGGLAYGTVAWLGGRDQVGPSIVGAAAVAATAMAVRWLFERWLTGQHANGVLLDTAVLVGNNADTLELSSMLTDEPELGYRVGAVLAMEGQPGECSGAPIFSGLDRLAEVITDSAAQDVMIIASALSPEERALAVHLAQEAGSRVHLWPGVPSIASRRVRVSPISGLAVLSIEPQRDKPLQAAVKRGVDMVLAASLMPFIAPVLLAAAVLIKLEDRGPVFYRHKVVGRFGVSTTVWKLRTMVPNAAALMDQVAVLNERTGGPLFKASNDPRVTRIGRILRGTSIDELPQLWNVLSGTLSLVGPRFALPSEVEHFDQGFLRRLNMRPGITGLWQTEARDNPSFSAYRRLDLFYVDNWSLALDLKILANTAHSVSVRALRAIFPHLNQEASK